MNTAPSDNALNIDLHTNDMVRNIVLFCVLIEITLVALDLFIYFPAGVHSPGIRDLFNLASEAGIGTWFSSTQTLVVAVILWLIRYRLKSSQSGGGRGVAGWTLLAAFFTYMAVDDAVAIHENLGSAFADIYTKSDDSMLGHVSSWLEEYPSYSWQIVVGPFFAAMGIFLLLFLWGELAMSRLRWLLVLALGSFSLAVALDYVEGLYGGYKIVILATGWQYETVLHVARVLEELIEMFGTTLFLATFLFHFGAIAGQVNLVFDKAKTH